MAYFGLTSLALTTCLWFSGCSRFAISARWVTRYGSGVSGGFGMPARRYKPHPQLIIRLSSPLLPQLPLEAAARGLHYTFSRRSSFGIRNLGTGNWVLVARYSPLESGLGFIGLGLEFEMVFSWRPLFVSVFRAAVALLQSPLRLLGLSSPSADVFELQTEGTGIKLFV